MPNSARTQPLVAVVTPVYNGGLYLGETIACVQAQTYSNLVHVLLDNASTDDTSALIDRARSGRVPIVAGRNPRLLPQRENWCAALDLTPSDASYFRLLCADDLMAPDCIARMVSLAESDPKVGMVGCLEAVGGTPAEPAWIQGYGLPTDIHAFDGTWFLKTYLMRLHRALSSTHMLIRRTFLDAETPFYRDTPISFDVDACMRLLLQTRYGFIHEPLGWTRLHEGSVTSTVTLPDQIFTSEWLLWLDRFGPSVMSEDEVQACRRAHLRHYLRRILLWRFKDGKGDIGVIASVIGAYYYLRIVFYMYFGTEPAVALDRRMAPVPWVMLMLSAFVMLAGVVNLFGIEGAAATAAAVFFLLSPFVFWNLGETLSHLRENRAVVIDRSLTAGSAFLPSLTFYARVLVEQCWGYPLAALVLVGAVRLAKRRPRDAVLWGGFAVPFLVFITFTFGAGRYLNPVIPAMAVAAGVAVSALKPRWAAAVSAQEPTPPPEPPQPPPASQSIEGEVVEVNAQSLTIRTTDGRSMTFSGLMSR